MTTTEETPTTPTHPVIRARDDDGTYGWDLTIYAMDRRTVLVEAQGATIHKSNSGDLLMLSVRSGRRDFEGDSLYLLRAEMFPGNTTWFGSACEIVGVLTELLYRTEEDLDAEIEGCPSGDGIYVPQGPLKEEGHHSWYGRPTPAIQVKVIVHSRHPKS